MRAMAQSDLDADQHIGKSAPRRLRRGAPTHPAIGQYMRRSKEESI
jgi:hypothetical protein